ncbi:MAG TPA: hypoxanthine phosphoribosyltransferase [Verrucomicrobiae bacterium]|nr:hypoxanthine phosphoribosyltransferase [Verrucomicrobiae bacterium]
MKVIYGPAAIAAAVERLARAIARDHAGQPLVLLGVLKGALYTTVDLARAISRLADGPSELYVDYLCAASYEGETSTGKVRLLLDAAVPLGGRRVLLVDDIADNGLTLAHLRSFLEERGPSKLQTCALFDKPSRRTAELHLDYVGLTVADAFVVGYGLDYQENYRTLPYLAELTNELTPSGGPRP